MSSGDMGDPHGMAGDLIQIPYVIDGGERRMLAALPKRPGFVQAAQPLSSKLALIPRSKWFDISYADYVVPVMDQHQESSCTGHGACGAFTKAWLMSGSTPRRFSAEFPYGNCNGGLDAGANVSEVGDSLWSKGICLASEVPEGMVLSRDFPAQAFVTGQRFRAKIYKARTWDELVSGLFYGYIPFYGLYVGRNFSRLDSRGVAPVGHLQPNHCIYADGFKFLSDGTGSIDGINSWGPTFGVNGRCQLVEGHLPPGSEICLIDVLGEDPQEQNEPPAIA